MKTALIILVCTVASFAAKAQANLAQADTTVFVAVQQPAEFPGGPEKLKSTIGKLLRYPADAREKRIQGVIPVGFIVEKDGTITHIKIHKSFSADTDAEALRIINKLPKWKPAMQNGNAVRFKYMVAVPFRLAD